MCAQRHIHLKKFLKGSKRKERGGVEMCCISLWGSSGEVSSVYRQSMCSGVVRKKTVPNRVFTLDRTKKRSKSHYLVLHQR